MKGVPEKSIELFAEQQGISVLDTYQKLYDGEKITFQLATEDNPKFDIKVKNQIVAQKLKFDRQIKF